MWIVSCMGAEEGDKKVIEGGALKPKGSKE